MPSQDPSDLLVELVASLREFWAARADDEDARAGVLSEAIALLPDDVARAEPHLVSVIDLLDRSPISNSIPILKKPIYQWRPTELATMLEAVQILDQWHRPIAPDLSGETWRQPTPEHLTAQSRLLVDGSYNSNRTIALLVPRHCSGWRLCPRDWIEAEGAKDYLIPSPSEKHFDLRAYLQFTSMVPADLPASSPDGGAGPDRRIRLRQIGVDPSVPVPDREEAHRILVAPMLHGADEVELTRAEKLYHVAPSDQVERVRAVVDAVYSHRGSVLFTPEMAMSDVTYAAMREVLRERHREACADGALPVLAYAIVGVMSTAGPHPRNFVAILSASGDVLAEQDKISRWDLTPGEQLWLGLGSDGDPLPDRLEESIVPAEEVRVIDLPGLGRLLVLICADMNIDEPGDFLFVNGGVNWVYAPIMDRTWLPVRTGPETSWILKRALRAAGASKGNVVVTNSMPLTTICNVTNAARGDRWPAATTCHVALMLDGRTDNPHGAIRDVALGAETVIVKEDWYDGWEAFSKEA